MLEVEHDQNMDDNFYKLILTYAMKLLSDCGVGGRVSLGCVCVCFHRADSLGGVLSLWGRVVPGGGATCYLTCPRGRGCPRGVTCHLLGTVCRKRGRD